MSSETLNTAGAFSQAKDLRNRILFTILLLIVYRLGTYVPLSGIDPMALKEIMASSQKGLLGMFNMFSGGAVTRMAIFALGIMPYISSSIIVQLLNFQHFLIPLKHRILEDKQLKQFHTLLFA